MFILSHAINSLSVKDNGKLKTGGKYDTFQNVNFLNHWLQNIRSCRKKKFFPENTIFKGIIFWYFQTATCYNSSLVLSRLDPALVKVVYNIACPNAVLCMDVGKSVDPFTIVFSSCQGHASTRYLFFVKATNKLKSKVLKNNTINRKTVKE